MKSKWITIALLLSAAATVLAPVRAAAQMQAPGAIEFVAHLKPLGGASEPVRQMSFYLLSKSMADIRAEVEQADAPPTIATFIDSTDLSKECKAWVKKHNMADFQGADFIKALTADDVMNVPEFFSAYKLQNGAALGARIPQPKYKAADKEKNPEKYQLQYDQYMHAMHSYIASNLDSLDGLDADLRDINPGRHWMQVQADYQKKAARRIFELAQTRYLVARTDSDLNGRGSLQGINPGVYWMTTLDTPAMAGDLHVSWDLPVNVHEGETVRLEFSNVNAFDTTEASVR